MLSESHEMRVKKVFWFFFFAVIVFLHKGNLEVLKEEKGGTNNNHNYNYT